MFKKEINFMATRKLWSIISATLVVVSIISLAVNSLNFGLDFTSGTAVRLSYSESANINGINDTLTNNGYRCGGCKLWIRSRGEDHTAN